MHGVILLSGLAPACLVLAYGVSRTRAEWRNEALVTAVAVGACAALICALVELGLLRLVNALALPLVVKAVVSAGGVAAIPEEGAKFAVLSWIVLRHVDVRRRQDVVLMALAVGMGFAAVENVFYLVLNGQWTMLAIMRAVIAVPAHGIYGLAMGSLMTLAWLRPAQRGRWLGLGLPVPVLLHAGFDFPLFIGRNAAWAHWTVPVLAGVVAVSAVGVVTLTDRVLRQAEAGDDAAGLAPPTRPGRLPLFISAMVVLIGMLTMLLAVAIRLVRPDTPLEVSVGLATLGVYPLALGLDLFRATWRRRRSMRRSAPSLAPAAI